VRKWGSGRVDEEMFSSENKSREVINRTRASEVNQNIDRSRNRK
jgi:hypothetical protein